MSNEMHRAVVITALPVERNAILEHLRNVAEEPPHLGSIYRKGIFDDRSAPWEVIVAEIGAGNVNAAAEAERVISHYSPEVALFVGVAGAIKDVVQGDVVASTKVYAYESGKDRDEGFLARPNVQISGYPLEQRARYEAGEPDWKDRIKFGDQRVGDLTPEAKVGPIAAGEKVLSTNRSEIFGFLKRNYGDALAVEMEGHGFLHGVHMNHPTLGLVIRGISDCISDKNEENDRDWQPVAARHAAAFAFQILAKSSDSGIASGPIAPEKSTQIEGTQELESYWNSLKAISEHELDPGVFTKSRDSATIAVTKWLADEPSALYLRSTAATEAIDFLAALSSLDSHAALQSSLIVRSLDAWHRLVSSQHSQILIVGPSLQLQSSDTSAAVQAGHRVFVGGPRVMGSTSNEHALNRQDYHSIEESLVSSGYSEARAMSLARACSGSTNVLKRLITQYPETEFPSWGRDELRPTLAPFALLGEWIHVDPPPNVGDSLFPQSTPIDTWAVTELLGCTRDELEEMITRWQRGAEPLFLRFGDHISISSREDVWYLLGCSVSTTHIKRFASLALLVLDEDNPAFELKTEDRWLAGVYGKVSSLSSEFRRSVIETLALMTTYKTVEPAIANYDPKEVVRHILEKALPQQAHWQRWASLDSNLPLISEADPEFLLDRIAADLNSREPELPKLFQDQSLAVFSGAIHTGLLWALETVAWSREYLSRAALCLAKLAALDPGGRYANRPANSLREIFLGWQWHTTAPLNDRLIILEEIATTVPSVGWKLLTDLLPGGLPQISHSTHLPRWRTWADGWSRDRVHPETAEYITGIGMLAVKFAGFDHARWENLIDLIFRVNPEITEMALKALETLSAPKHSSNDISAYALWNTLRQLLLNHQKHDTAPWVYPKSVRDRLQTVCDRIQPADPARRHRWLFEQHVELPDLDPSSDWKAYQKVVEARRIEALEQIVSTAGVTGILELLSLGGDASAVGWIFGTHTFKAAIEFDLPTLLESEVNEFRTFASSFIAGNFSLHQWRFVNRTVFDDWNDSQLTAFARSLPFNEATWDWLASFNESIREEYWEKVAPSFRLASNQEVRRAVSCLLDVGRWSVAIRLLQFATSDEINVSSTFVADVLESRPGETERDETKTPTTQLAYSIRELVKLLQGDPAFDRVRLARIEWKYLSILQPDISDVTPVTLLNALQTEPGFVIELLVAAYKSDSDVKASIVHNEQEILQAHYAYRLLHDFARLPGLRDDYSLDREAVVAWMEQVQRLADDVNRRSSCDRVIGNLVGKEISDFSDFDDIAFLGKSFERLGSTELFSAMTSGILNSRGVVRRGPFEGGDSERALANRFRDLSARLSSFCSGLAKTLGNVSDIYFRRARQEDEQAERRKLGRW